MSFILFGFVLSAPIVEEIKMRVEVSTAREEVGDVDELILTKVVRESVEARLTAYTGAESCERENDRVREGGDAVAVGPSCFRRWLVFADGDEWVWW